MSKSGLSPAERLLVRDAVATDLLTPSSPVGKVSQLLGRTIDLKTMADVLHCMECGGKQVLDEVLVQPDLVVSGPTPEGIYARQTSVVLQELIRGAQHRLLLSTFAYYDGASQFGVLAEHMESLSQLDVTLFLNIHRKTNGVARNDAVRQFALRFWQEDWPGTRRPSVFYDPRSLTGDGVLHAKVVVTDRTRLFVTSANFTAHAQETNIEMGILLRDRSLALAAEAYFASLVEKQLLLPLPHP